MFLARMPLMSPASTSNPNSVSYRCWWPEPCCDGQDEFGPSGLKFVAGPHWKPAMNRELLRSGLLPDFAMPLVDPLLLLVPQAAISGPPKASPAPARPVSRRNSRLDRLEKTLMTFPLLSVLPTSRPGGPATSTLLSTRPARLADHELCGYLDVPLDRLALCRGDHGPRGGAAHLVQRLVHGGQRRDREAAGSVVVEAGQRDVPGYPHPGRVQRPQRAERHLVVR